MALLKDAVETQLLRQYLAQVGGIIYGEVPIGKIPNRQFWSEKCTVRRIDGVRIPLNLESKPQEIIKDTQATRAWFAFLDEYDVFIKWYPLELRESWAKVEAAIAGANLHPAIVPLRQTVNCADGVLLIYDRVKGRIWHHKVFVRDLAHFRLLNAPPLSWPFQKPSPRFAMRAL